MPMTIAILGAGNVGAALGANWSGKGYAIRFGVRKPDDAKYAALKKDGVTFHTMADAVSTADAVVLATPWPETEGIVKSLEGLQGKIILDCTNPLRFADGALGLSEGFSTSGGEMVAAWAPQASVFKTLNQTGAANMVSPAYASGKPVMFVAGDDEARKSLVIKMVSDLGFDAIDAGGLMVSRYLEPLAMLWIHMAVNLQRGTDFAFALLKR